MKSKLQSLGFTSGHAHLLLVAVAVFSVLFVVQSDISFKALFANADDEVKMLTYDEVRNEVAMAYGGVPTNPEAEAEAERQLALLERSLDSGQVLGEAIGIGTIPSAENIFSREQLNMIVVNTVPTSQSSIQKYSEQVLGVESQNGAIEMMGDLNSSDPEVLGKVQERVGKIVSNLKGLQAPSELADYHRYKMIYYQSLASMAESFATNTLDTDFQNTSKIMFSVMERIEQTKSQIQSKYQVSL